MYFEQMLIGDPNYYHQNQDGWKSWCDDHFSEIKADFDRDLKTMASDSQRYFGDWVSYNGHGDVGYYLGCRFVRFILSAHINWMKSSALILIRWLSFIMSLFACKNDRLYRSRKC